MLLDPVSAMHLGNQEMESDPEDEVIHLLPPHPLPLALGYGPQAGCSRTARPSPPAIRTTGASVFREKLRGPALHGVQIGLTCAPPAKCKLVIELS